MTKNIWKNIFSYIITVFSDKLNTQVKAPGCLIDSVFVNILRNLWKAYCYVVMLSGSRNSWSFIVFPCIMRLYSTFYSSYDNTMHHILQIEILNNISPTYRKKVLKRKFDSFPSFPSDSGMSWQQKMHPGPLYPGAFFIWFTA